MDTQEEIDDFIKNGYRHYLPHLTIDSVIFGYQEQQLKILLLKWIGYEGWAYPVVLLSGENQ